MSPHVGVNTHDPFFQPKVTVSYPRIEPHDDAARVIGRRTAYRGSEYAYLVGRVVVVVAVLKDALRADEHAYLTTEDEIRAAGGVGPFDRIEVSAWMPDAGRLSFATCDPKAVDLDGFAHG